MRPIDADTLKDKLQQHHDFYVMAWGGFGRMPISEKKRVDEITNCIAEVVNAPTITADRPQGEWKDQLNYRDGSYYNVCSECGYFDDERDDLTAYNFCPDCGADMRKESE